MTHQLNILLLILGASQGALMSWYFLHKQARHLANTYFVFILITIGLQMTFKVLSKAWLAQQVGPIYFMSYNLPYLIGPLLYLYVRSRRGIPFRKFDLLHFLPFALTVAIVILQGDTDYWTSPFRYLTFPVAMHAVVQALSLGLYARLSWRLIRPEWQSSLRQFIIGLVTVELIIIAALTIMYLNYPRYSDARLLFISLTVLVYWISYKHLEHPDLFVSRQMSIGEGDNAATASLQVQPHTKYKHSGLKDEEGQVIAQHLHHLMTEEKIYLNPDLTLDKMAARLNISRYVLSQVLNEKFQKPYVDFVNEQRLTEAQTRLHNPKYNHYTIAAIAMDSGFNSLSRFNEYFRKRVGMTPSAFREQALNRMTA